MTYVDYSVTRISYGENEHQFGNLYVPKNDQDDIFPLVVLIHGGFWRAQYDLEHIEPLAEAIVKEGFAVWNIEYNRVGHHGGAWPGTMTDCADAVDYIHDLAKRYPVDVSRVIAMGHSAGGHLALWLGPRKRLPENSPLRTSDQPFPLKGIIALAPVTHLEMMYSIHYWEEKLFQSNDNPTMALMGGRPDRYKERYEQASPFHLLPIAIPTVLLHGKLDTNVPHYLSKLYEQEANRRGANVKLKSFPTLEHFALIHPYSEAWPTLLDVLEQLSE